MQIIKKERYHGNITISDYFGTSLVIEDCTANFEHNQSCMTDRYSEEQRIEEMFGSHIFTEVKIKPSRHRSVKIPEFYGMFFDLHLNKASKMQSFHSLEKGMIEVYIDELCVLEKIVFKLHHRCDEKKWPTEWVKSVINRRES